MITYSQKMFKQYKNNKKKKIIQYFYNTWSVSIYYYIGNTQAVNTNYFQEVSTNGVVIKALF